MTKKLFAIALLTVALVSGFVAGRASADQPHMQTALDDLQAAKVELQAADPDKGGHRVAALSLVNKAITQVQEGIRYAREH